MSLIDIIGWIVVGLIAGWLASMFMGKGGYGMIGDIIVGLIGAIIGGWLVGLIFGTSLGGQSWYITIPVAFIGAVILIAIVRAVTGSRTTV